MAESIGAKQFGIIRPSGAALSPLKREALFFDSLVITRDILEGILNLRKAIHSRTGKYIGRTGEAASILLESEVLVFADDLLGMELGPEFILDSAEGQRWLEKDDISTGVDASDVGWELSENDLKGILSGYCRKLSNALAEKGIRASTIYPTTGSFEAAYNAADVACLSVILRSLPVPIEEVTWEQIIEFRNDPDSQRKLRALRDWQNDITKEGLADHAIVDKLAHLLDDYTQHMNHHKLKYEMGKAEIILRTGAGVLEGLAKFKLTKAVDAMFSFKKRSLDLKEAELQAPGREVAFIHKVKETFG